MTSLQATEVSATRSHTVDDHARVFVPVLRRIEWPAVAPVDLLAECPWLIHGDKVVAARTAATDHTQDGEREEDANGHVAVDVVHNVDDRPQGGPPTSKVSPYKQPLRVQQEPRAPLSPGQRAARKMLKLQDEIERREDFEARVRAARMPGPAGHRATAVTKKGSPQKPVKQAFLSWRKRKAKQEQYQSPQRRLADWMAHQRPEDEELVAYSMEMETRIHMTTTETLGKGLWKDAVASLIAAELTSESVFGGFVPTRRLGFHASSQLENKVITVLDDPSLTASAPISSASSGIMIAQDETPPRISVVQLYADDIREEAHALAAEGNVDDALATLQRGIDAVLHDFQDNQDEINAHGFNYSRLAHTMAIRVQLKYRARHRRRVACLVRLQRVWRRFRAKNKFLLEWKYRTTSAEIIQRHYKKHFYWLKHEQCATRIQRCFRIYKEQKLLVMLRRSCRMLNSQERRKREQRLRFRALQRKLWIKLKVILKAMWLIKTRQLSVTSMQKRWRGWKAREAYASVLSREDERERTRRAREDAVVETRLQEALRAMEAFYEGTSCGKTFVKWQKKRPWLRWSRLRSEWPRVNLHDRAAALCGIYKAANGSTNKITKRQLVIRTMSRLLGGDASTQVDAQELRVSIDGLKALAESSMKQTASDSNSSTVLRTEHVLQGRLQRLRSRISQIKSRWTVKWKASRQSTVLVLFDLCWRVVLYPSLLVTRLLHATRNRQAAVCELMTHQERLLRAALRRTHRVCEGESPKYICTWCGEGFGTTRMFLTHRKRATGCQEQERIASHERQMLETDLKFYRNRSLWTQIKFQQQFQNQNDTRDQITNSQDKTSAWVAAFALDAPPVRRVISWRNRTALVHVLSVARWCGPSADHSPVIPSDVLALLLFALDDRLHPLQRVQALTVSPDWTTVGSLSDPMWVHVDQVARALGVRATTRADPSRQRRQTTATPLLSRWFALRHASSRVLASS